MAARRVSMDEIQELLDKELPPADRKMPREIVRENLESFGTSRAYFHNLSDEGGDSVARRISIHLSIQQAGGTPRREEREIFFHVCGSAGIDYDETRTMWANATWRMSWNEVYELDGES